MSVCVRKSQYLFDNMKNTTSLLQLTFPLLVSVFLSKAAADCEVEWDDQNVVATQLEGTWAINENLTLVLSPSQADKFENYPQIK